jgi:hypothetical protein
MSELKLNNVLDFINKGEKDKTNNIKNNNAIINSPFNQKNNLKNKRAENKIKKIIRN